MKDEDAKATLITLLNELTMRGLDQYIILQGEVDSADLTAKQRLDKVPYIQINFNVLEVRKPLRTCPSRGLSYHFRSH